MICLSGEGPIPVMTSSGAGQRGRPSLSTEELSTSVIGLFGAGFETSARGWKWHVLLRSTPRSAPSSPIICSWPRPRPRDCPVRVFIAGVQNGVGRAVVAGHEFAAGDRVLTIVPQPIEIRRYSRVQKRS